MTRAPTEIFPEDPILKGEIVPFSFAASPASTWALATLHPLAQGAQPIDVSVVRAAGPPPVWQGKIMGYALEAGRYRFTIFEGFADGTKRALATLPLHVLDPAASDPRTPAAIAVEKLEAYLSGDRALETRKYSIAGASGGARALERHSLEELRALLEYWRRRLAVEEANAAGRGIIRHIRQRI